MKKTRSSALPLVTLLAASSAIPMAHAKSATPPRSIPDKKAGPRCDRDGRDVKDMNRLLEDLEKNKRLAPTVDAFLGMLPDSIRSSIQFVADSHSIQESNLAAPRVILKSPNSEVTLTFNAGKDPATGKGLRGYDAVELQVWDAKQKRFFLTEIHFPGDLENPPTSGTFNAKIERNPQSCVTCHGGGADSAQTPRAIFNPYRQWDRFIPFSEDRLDKGSPEVTWYQAYLAGIESGQPRLRQLKSQLTLRDIDEAFRTQNSIQIPSTHSYSTQPVNTPGLDMSHQLLKLNGCKIVGDLKRDPAKWDAIKYALAGALQKDTCNDPSIFLSPEQNQHAVEWFRARGITSVLEDTKARQNHLSEMREGNELWFLKSNLGSFAKAESAVALTDQNNIRGRGRSGPNSKGYPTDDPMITSRSRFPTFENYAEEITKTRYIMDPLGFQSNLWSMAEDPDTFGHVEFFKEITEQKEIDDVWKDSKRDCNRLAEKSRQALRDFPLLPVAPAGFRPATALAMEASQRASDPATAPTLETLRKSIQPVLMNKCLGCHLSGFNGAPKIPFNDLPALEKMLSERKGKVGDFSEILWDRVTRAPEAFNPMPLMMPPLSSEEKTDLRAWLNLIPAADSK